MRPPRLMALAGLVLVAGPALTASITPVAQRNRNFEVGELQIARGGAVRFTNDDDFPHQIAIRGPSMRYESDLMAPHQLVDVQFADAGSFEVRCGVHPRMRMTIQVR